MTYYTAFAVPEIGSVSTGIQTPRNRNPGCGAVPPRMFMPPMVEVGVVSEAGDVGCEDVELVPIL